MAKMPRLLPPIKFCKTGSAKAAVFPDPVWDWAMTSTPVSIKGITCAWTSVGVV